MWRVTENFRIKSNRGRSFPLLVGCLFSSFFKSLKSAIFFNEGIYRGREKKKRKSLFRLLVFCNIYRTCVLLYIWVSFYTVVKGIINSKRSVKFRVRLIKRFIIHVCESESKYFIL